MIRIQQLKLPVGHTDTELEQLIAKSLRMQQGSFTWKIVRRSLDARRKPELFYIYTVDVTVPKETAVLKKIQNRKQISRITEKRYVFPYREVSGYTGSSPMIIGSGPAGLFCALMLARAGLKPIILERGKSVEERTEDVTGFWQGGKLNPSSNVQFGEGGAGTFSDGKLNTAIKDPESRIRFVLDLFVEAGADPQILYDYKPHVGTDVLTGVVRHIREEIESLGGRYLFEHQLIQMQRSTEVPGYSLLVRNASGEEITFYSDSVVLAIGHSARDTFQMLQDMGMPMQPKAFAMGVRVIHPQSLIDTSQYGTGPASTHMPPAPYKLTHKLADGRGVYSFCMCPGGYVVNASSEEGRLAVNGMSYHDRASGYANSAIVVTVPVTDFPDSSPLGGVALQRELEEKAFAAGQGSIPVQTFRDFRSHTDPVSLQEQEDSPSDFITPAQAIRGTYRFADVRGLLPASIGDGIEEGLIAFDRQIHGFAHDCTLLCGIESRTSSPVRILRTDTLESEDFPGIYPCGEGAGYAGGITSAAVDGIRVAEALIRNTADRP